MRGTLAGTVNDSASIPDIRSLAQRIAKAPPLADAKRARARLADLKARAAEAPDASGFAGLLEQGPLKGVFASIADHSPFLWQLVLENPARLQQLAGAAPEEAHRAIVARQTDNASRFAKGELGRDEVARALRRNRAEHALLVALADIGGVWSVDEVTAALTAFADASVKGAVGVVLSEGAADGKIKLADADDPGAGSGFVILALGKHGAGELNYSSDIDLVVFFDSTAAPLAEGVEPTTFYTRVVRDLARLLQERTGDGYVHRVRLSAAPRPGLDADRRLARLRLHLLRDGRAELGARRPHQGAPGRRRPRPRRTLPPRPHAVHLAQIFRFCRDRRRARDEASDPRSARP